MEEKIIKSFLRDGIIESGDAEIYLYGIRLFVKRLIHTLIILTIGLIGREFWGIFAFLISYATIREYSGGYHAKSASKCYCCTAAVTISVLALLKLLKKVDTLWIQLLMLICGCIIWVLSPQETGNRPLENPEKIAYRKVTRRYLMLFGAITVIGFFYMEIVKGIACAWLIQVVMLFIGMFGTRK